MPVDRARPPGLHRGLTRIDVIALTVNNIVGAGIFTLPATLVAGAGSWSVGVLVVTVGLVALLAVCAAEVASRYDVTGGPMYYAHVAFGPSAGFVVGWLMYLSRLAAFGAVAATMLDYGAGLWPPLASAAVRIAAITIFIGVLAVINVRGVVHGARVTGLLTAVKLLPLLLLAAAGLWLTGWMSAPSLPPPSSEQLGGSVMLVFFACMGFETAAVISGELRNPRRDLPIGMLGGVAGTGLLYTLLLFACFATVPDLAHARRPLADAAAALIGPVGMVVMSLGVVLSTGANLTGWMIASPRVLYALGHQGDVPNVFAHIDPVRRTPAVAIVASALLVWLLTVTGTFVYLATFSALSRLLMYASTSAALIQLRRRDGPAPVAVPFGPLWSVMALVCTFAALATTTGTAVRDVTIAVALGCLLRLATRRSRSSGAPASAAP